MTASPQSGHWICVASVEDLAVQRKLVRKIDGLEILLCRYGAEVAALYNCCTHLGKPLDAGRIMGGQITCPFHGACFDLRTGAAVSGPAVHPAHLFPVRVEAGKIFVNLEKRPSATAGFPAMPAASDVERS